MLTHCYQQPNISASLIEAAYGTPDMHLYPMRDRLDPTHSRSEEVSGVQ